MPKVFVSYSHEQREWVWGRLVPVLKATGADVLIDVERFKAGVSCFKQMDAEQDAADLHVLCFSEEYLSSKFCDREWKRAVKSDPSFAEGKVVPIVLKAGLTLPKQIRGPTPLHVNMRDDRDPEIWKLLLRSLRLDWTCCPVSWLDAAEWTASKLRNGECINLLLPRSLNNGHRQPMEALLAHLRNATLPRKLLPDLKQVDLHSGVCSTLSGLLSQILDQAGIRQELSSARRKALVAFTQQMRTLSAPLLLTLSSCDLLGNAERQSEYGVDFFAALFDLTQPPNRKLSLLAISRRPYASLLPSEAYVSAINFTTIELRVT